MQLRWRLLPPAVYIFNYHRIGRAADCAYNDDLFSCTPERLREHLERLLDRFTLIGLAELQSLMGRRRQLNKPYALLTFDDGYRDNYTLAYPLLKTYKVPAVFFIPTAFVDTSHLHWGDEIAWILRHSRVPRVRLPQAANSFNLVGDAQARSVQAVLGYVKRRKVPIAEQMRIISDACGAVTPDANCDRPEFMTWPQLRQMHSAGMDIGSHTHTHRILSRLSPEEQRRELQTSKAIIEDELSTPVNALAYPVGASFAFTPETCRLASEVGYSLAFTYQRRPNRFPIRDAFRICRLSVDDDMDADSLVAACCFPGLFA